MDTPGDDPERARTGGPQLLTPPAGGAVWTRAGRQLVPGNRWDLATPGPPGSVSVVIPYHEAPSDLLRLLASLEAQTRRAEEVIVVDDGSRHAPARDVVGDRPGVSVLSRGNDGVRPGAARNLGARAASGEVLVFLDSDIVAHPTFISCISQLPATLDDALVVGRCRYAVLDDLSPEDAVAFCTAGEQGSARWLPEPERLRRGLSATRDLLDIAPDSWRLIHASAMAISSSLFDDLEGFDDRLEGLGGEDWELAHRALHSGAVLAHEPRAVAVHNGPFPDHHGDGALSPDDFEKLTPLITDRGFRPENMMGETTRIVAYLDDQGWSDEERHDTVTALLSTIKDIRVVTTSLDDLPPWALGEPRVKVDRPELQHCHVLVTVHTPVEVTPDALRALALLDPGGLDHVVVTTEGQRVATLSAARTVERVRRATADGRERELLWASLAAAEDVDARRAGFVPLSERTHDPSEPV